MVKHSIQVYARVKNEGNSDKTVAYEIVRNGQKYEDIVIYNNFLQYGSTACSFRKVLFHKVFDQKSSQEEVFDDVAKSVINSVLQGFNGTIFAYGQTGSGKTYSITGSPKNYNDRGIIPRSIQYAFAQNEKVTVKPTMYISYMEIYNEVGYDLLSSRQDNSAKSLEELPRIVLLEDSAGEVHMRNLSVLPVATEQEAMRLLFLGDTNRIIAETPMNEYSSRSHCIFTFYLTFRDEPSNIVRYSKLHLVDLAGSERVCKSLTTGTALREAKHINLSLHYLQQVILALSESNRIHVPYRNSMMTYILKDSLSGNCLTAMLATLALNRDNIQETISTCRFAQRVSMISTTPVINEIRDPQKEIAFLRNTVDELRRQISQLSHLSTEATLDKNQEEQCRREVERYVASTSDELRVAPSMASVQYCFRLMRDKINSRSSEVQGKQWGSAYGLNIKKENEDNIIDEMQESLMNLNGLASKKNLLSSHDTKETNKNVIVNYWTNERDAYPKHKTQYDKVPPESNLRASKSDHDDEKQLLEAFLRDPENSKDLDYYTRNLQKKLETAKIHADTIDQCQKNITYIRRQLQTRSDNTLKNKLVVELEQQQKIYSKSLNDLRTVKNETFHLQSGLRKAEIKTLRSFKSWMEGLKVNNSLSTTGQRDSVENVNCLTCNGNQDVLRKLSTRECSCQTDMEKRASLGCCNSVHLEHPANYWANCWTGSLCLGPVCQPLVVDPGQCCDHSDTYTRVPICKGNFDVYKSESSCRMLCQSGVLHNPECMVRFENAASMTKTCQSSPVIWHGGSWNTDFNAKRTKHDEAYCCRGINSDHQFEKDIKTICNAETRSCHKYDVDCTHKSLHTISEECRCPFSSAADVCKNQEVDDDQPDSDESDNEDEDENAVCARETSICDLTKETDSAEFRDFMKTVPLTGELEIDQEIFNFYRNKFCS